MIKINVSRTCAEATQRERLTSGMQGVELSFSFSADWNDLVKTAVFEGSGRRIALTNIGDSCIIPHEVLAKHGSALRVGVYGRTADGSAATPTVYAQLGIIQRGADPNADPSTKPTLPVWAQIQTQIGDLSNLTTEDKTNLVAAINEAAKSGGGSGGGDHANLTNRFFGKVANFLGDSQTDDAGNYKSVFFYDWLKDILGLSATNNYGYSGTTIMPIEGQNRSFLERYTSMSNDADLIVVWGGTNDYQYGHALGEVNDTANTTFCGALNNLCKGLIAKYPQKSILFVTPTPRGNIASAVATQKEYADAIIDVCAKYCIPVFDAFRKCNMPIIADSTRRYTVDGLHLNNLGHEILGKSMANFILYSEMSGAQAAWGENGGNEPVVNVTGVTLNKTTQSLTIDETVQLVATIEPTNATNQNISWSASNGNCTVSNGLVMAVAAGNCTITATTEDGNRTASCVVTVSEAVADVPESPVDGKIVSYAAAASYPQCTNVTALMKVRDLPDTGTKLTMKMKIADASQTITAYGKGMQTFQDETGLLNNGAFKQPALSGYMVSTMEGDEIVGVASLYGYKMSDATYEYAKIPISIIPAAYPVSFKVVSMTIDVDGTYIPIQAVGGFYAVEGYSESE